MVIPFGRKAEAAKPIPRKIFHARNSPGAEPVPLVGNTDPWSWLLAASLKIDLWKLGRFNELMVEHQLPVHLGRMFRDPTYAYDRLALAHGTGAGELKVLALEMFEQYLLLERRRRSPEAPTSPFVRH